MATKVQGPILAAYYEHNESIPETAQALGITTALVHQAVCAHMRTAVDVKKNECMNDLLTGRLTYKMAAEKYKVSQTTIGKWVRSMEMRRWALTQEAAQACEAEMVLILSRLDEQAALIESQKLLIDTQQEALANTPALIQELHQQSEVITQQTQSIDELMMANKALMDEVTKLKALESRVDSLENKGDFGSALHGLL